MVRQGIADGDRNKANDDHDDCSEDEFDPTRYAGPSGRGRRGTLLVLGDRASELRSSRQRASQGHARAAGRAVQCLRKISQGDLDFLTSQTLHRLEEAFL